jgi:opacity protein-like surface antigen
MQLKLSIQKIQSRFNYQTTNMKKFLLVFIFLNTVIFAEAQWRLQVQAGPSISLRPVNKDSLFAAKKTGFHVQGRAVYFWGHFGLGLTVGYLQQNVRSDANKNPPPRLLNGIDTFTVKGGGVKAVYLLAGPEFCFACGNKFKFNLGIRAGVSLLPKGEPFQLSQQGTLRYENVLKSKAPFTFNMGIGAHYFLDQHWAVGLMADYHHFNLKVNNRDIRRGINNIVLLKQGKDNFNVGGSLIYKF